MQGSACSCYATFFKEQLFVFEKNKKRKKALFALRLSTPVCTLPVLMLLAHTCTQQHPPHAHAAHDHMKSGTLVS
jgi:hypothetical protein